MRRVGLTMLVAASSMAYASPGNASTGEQVTTVASAGIGISVGHAPPHDHVWQFSALLDGKPIGQHRFSVKTQGTERTVISEADFSVTVLGITAYRYRHKATEQWRGDCIDQLASTTDDDGKATTLRMRRDGVAQPEPDVSTRGTPPSSIDGCIMSFAYWNPAIQRQTRLLNAQTGKVESVQVQRVGSGRIEVRGQPVEANEFRIVGAAQPIHVWYSPQGAWLGLDSTVAGGRKLSYRLQ